MTLEELFKHPKLYGLSRCINGYHAQSVYEDSNYKEACGKTPEEAVNNLLTQLDK